MLCAPAIFREKFVYKLITMFNISGTLLSSCQLVKQQGGDLLGCVVLVELTDLHGVDNLPVKCHSIIQY